MMQKIPTYPASTRNLLAKMAKLKGDKEFESRGLVGHPRS